MIDVSSEKGLLDCATQIMRLMQSVKQAVLPELSPLIWLPHFDQGKYEKLKADVYFMIILSYFFFFLFFF